ncbi:glycosyltransferase [bacterium]|nr:glycosyltransferase [bacterium]
MQVPMNRPEEIERAFDTRTRDQYRVSALVSLYNSEKYLPGLMEDLLGQTLYERDELEIVFVDSHSPTDDWAVLRGYAARYPHLRAIRTIQR